MSVRTLGWLIVVTVGTACAGGPPPNLPGWALAPSCADSAGAPSYATAIPADSATRKPQLRTSQRLRTPALHGHLGRVQLRYVVDTTGHVAPCSVHVVSTTDTELNGPAASWPPSRSSPPPYWPGTRWPSGRSRRSPSRSTDGRPGLGVRGV